MTGNRVERDIPQDESLPTKELPFAGKVALITGASNPNGIGAAIAENLGRNGATLVLTATERSTSEGLELADRLSEATSAVWLPADLTKASDRQNIIRESLEWFGRLDILVCNAGVRDDDFFIRLSEERLREVFEVNFFASALLMQEGIKQMRKQRPKGGSIIVTSSIATEGNPGQASYSSSKAALNGLVRTLAKEYFNSGIFINAVAPGIVPGTNMTEDLTEEQIENLLDLSLGERLTPQDIAHVISQTLLPSEKPVTGQIIPILTRVTNYE